MMGIEPKRVTKSNQHILTSIIPMTWTKKHDEFCLEQKLRPSTILMLRWILRRANNHNVCEIEVDLRLFNTWIAKKRGTPYDRKTIKEAIAQLDECTQGLVLITKEYTPWVKKLLGGICCSSDVTWITR